ncbi:lactate utilization protein C [Amorphus sp. 3PC139-8]|uniref:LutC/YkgG family protein n=1 Tax=Amorphus sp. 3PC139-8 TaxID=2735676 RepID=UPI00345C9599
MKAKDQVLGRIRSGLCVDPARDEARRRAVAERLAAHPRNTVPARGALAQEERVALFRRMAESVSATTDRVANTGEIASAIATYLGGRNDLSPIRRGTDPRFDAVDWSAVPGDVRTGPAEDGDQVGIAYALAGIAETGTSMLVSGPHAPTTIAFLPEVSIILVDAATIAGDLESAFDLVRERGDGTLPRTVNLITGPSRSADIEQTLLLGAHGPRALHLIVVG